MHDVSFNVASLTRNAHQQEHDRPQVREMCSNARFFFLCTFYCFHAERALYAIFGENNYSDLIREVTKMVSVGVLCNSTIGSDVGRCCMQLVIANTHANTIRMNPTNNQKRTSSSIVCHYLISSLLLRTRPPMILAHDSLMGLYSSLASKHGQALLAKSR